MRITDIYYEHIEEAAFLYDQRNNLLSEPDGNLEYQSQIEEYLEAHIDGLKLGGEHSKPILEKYLDSDDEGEFFSSVYSLLRMGEAEQNEVIKILGTAPIPSSIALCNAFRFTDSETLNEMLSTWLTYDSPAQKAVAVEVLGYKHYSKALPIIKELLTDNDIAVKAAAMKAVNRLDPGLGRKTAYTSLIEDNSIVIEEIDPDPVQKTRFEAYIDACFENLFIQREKTVFQIARQYCERKYPFHPTAPVLLGLNAGVEDIQLLLNMLKADNIHRSVFQAIGFIGKIDLLERLIPLEDHTEYNLPVQEAAHLILGTDPPDYGKEHEEDAEENKQFFSLAAALSSLNIQKSDRHKRHRLGKLISKENEKEILLAIAAMYRRWVYPDMNNKPEKGRGLEYSDLAEWQYCSLRSM